VKSLRSSPDSRSDSNSCSKPSFKLTPSISGNAIDQSSFETDQARFDAALEKIREKRPVVEELVEEPAEEEAASVTEAVAENVAEEPPDSAEVAADPQDIFNAEQHWHEFWNPFRSELAARGFVSRLEKVTGLDYRIIKVEPGVYQVGFAYTSDDERRSKILLISAATGLDLPAT